MKFTPRSEETRQFIIETAAGIFNVKGYAGTSMSDLTEATKLTKGSIYGNFENKEEVALAVFDYNVLQRNQVIKSRLNAAIGCKDKLMVYADIYRSFDANPLTAGGCPLLNTGVEADDTHEPLRKKVSRELINWKKEIVNIITDGKTSKEFREDTDAEKTALAMIAMIEGGILIGRSTKNPIYLDTILEAVKDLIQKITTGKKK